MSEIVHLHLVGPLQGQHSLVVLIHHSDDCVLYKELVCDDVPYPYLGT